MTDGTSLADISEGMPHDLETDGERGTLYVYKSESTAAMYISTESGMDRVHADKENKDKVDIRLYTDTGKIVYDGMPKDKISGHGNSTWELDKKPYDLHMDEATDLLGMGKAKKWVLLADAYDETHMKNALVYRYARENAPYSGFAPDCEYVDLYADNEYMGLYLLTKSVKDTKLRSLDKELTHPYAFELTMTGKVGEDADSIALNDAMSVEIKLPSKYSDAERQRLESIVLSVNDMLSKGGKGSVELDESSWAAKILLEMMFENYDAANASQYFWGDLEGCSVYAGPCWDYDLSMGRFYVDWSTPYALMTFKDWNKGRDRSWYAGAWSISEIRDRVISMYRDGAGEKLSALIDSVPAEAQRIASSVRSDRIRWKDMCRYDSFDAAVADMQGFMYKRKSFLDSYLIKGDPYYRVTMELPNGRILHRYVPTNTSFPELPAPSELSAYGEDLGDLRIWYRKDTGEVFTRNTLVTEDTVLVAVK
ncbi:MAG: CotH kinase family protein, partial [Oscillospiraceae bacterium]|nr:CotH kinase family protein [Oscillospiraceae bacterium]